MAQALFDWLKEFFYSVGSVRIFFLSEPFIDSPFNPNTVSPVFVSEWMVRSFVETEKTGREIGVELKIKSSCLHLVRVEMAT